MIDAPQMPQPDTVSPEKRLLILKLISTMQKIVYQPWQCQTSQQVAVEKQKRRRSLGAAVPDPAQNGGKRVRLAVRRLHWFAKVSRPGKFVEQSEIVPERDPREERRK